VRDTNLKVIATAENKIKGTSESLSLSFKEIATIEKLNQVLGIASDQMVTAMGLKSVKK
jgi:hypothetical protein